ncbi:hypothetical protein BJ684DRAFT_8456 [Piptocephalis cylindrospora]|uniref:EF-hand domain-containing protein n=1 Tax=Piptocephalis cylindrospora TaxID=1907219 RepID=A0A4P9Y6A8_9FUNG|nr:hypothetical protein BJ684DRAFT_8456 [Piptocephalis cylindrospora]|eukprot:RKP14525.1 hypothetical protein BJ684DRAFT_8456 [Piptocephalis cylindrospora]
MATLLEEDGDISPKFEAALRAMFKCHDRDQDGALCPAELDAFATLTNGEPFDEDTLVELHENFDLNDQGWLTLKGFFQLYFLQTEGEPEETWKDLKAHGFDRDLEPLSNSPDSESN